MDYDNYFTECYFEGLDFWILLYLEIIFYSWFDNWVFGFVTPDSGSCGLSGFGGMTIDYYAEGLRGSNEIFFNLMKIILTYWH